MAMRAWVRGYRSTECRAVVRLLLLPSALFDRPKPVTQPALGNLAKICPFHNTRSEPPPPPQDVEKQIQRLQTDIQRLNERCDVQERRNISLKEEQAVINLRNEEDRLITRSDKGGEIVVMKDSHLDESLTHG